MLGIEELILYNHSKDHVKFKDKISDVYLLENIDIIKKIFRISGKEYKDFDKIGGYGRLYNMSLSMFSQVCGNDLMGSNEQRKQNNKITSYEYNVKTKLLQEHLLILLKRKKKGINENILKFLKILPKTKNDFYDDL